MKRYNSLAEILNEVYPLQNEVTAKLEKVSKLRHFNKNQHLVTQGRKCTSIFFVAEGLLRGIYEKDETTDTRWFASEGDVLTSVTAFHKGAPAIFSIEAISDVDAYVVEFDDFKEIIQKSRDLQDWLVRLLMEQLYVLEQRYIIIGTGDALSRYEALLRARPIEVLNAIPLKYIAQYLKITPETLSRVRRNRVRTDK